MAGEVYDIDVRVNPDTRGIASTERALIGVERAGREMGRQVDRVDRSVRTLNRTFTMNIAQLGAAEAAMRGVDKAGGGVNKMMTVLMGLVSGFAAYAFGRSTLEGFAHWELALVGISKTTELTSSELHHMGEEILHISRHVPIAANDLAAIAQAAGQVGVSKANLIDFAKTVADLGVATNLHGEDAVISLSKILTLTKEAETQARTLGSVMVELGNNFAAFENEIAFTSLQIAKVISRYGVSSTDLAAISTALIQSGQQPELSRSGMQRFFAQMAEGVNGDRGIMKEMIRLTGETGDALKGLWATDPVELMIKVMEGLNAEGANVKKTLERMGLAGLRVDAVLAALAGNVDVLRRSVRMAREEAARPDALDSEIEKFYAAFANQMKLVKAHVGEAKDLFGEKLAPAVLKAANAYKEYVAGLIDGGAVARAGEQAGKLLTAAVGQLGNALLILKSIIGSVLIVQIARLGKSLLLLHKAVPVLALLAAGGAFVSGVQALSSAFGSLGERIERTGHALKEDVFAVEFEERLKRLGRMAGEFAAVLLTVFVGAGRAVYAFMGSLLDSILDRMMDTGLGNFTAQWKRRIDEVLAWAGRQREKIGLDMAPNQRAAADRIAEQGPYDEFMRDHPVGGLFGLDGPPLVDEENLRAAGREGASALKDGFREGMLLGQSLPGMFESAFEGIANPAQEKGVALGRHSLSQAAYDRKLHRLDWGSRMPASMLPQPERTREDAEETVQWAQDTVLGLKNQMKSMFIEQLPAMFAESFIAVVEGVENVGDAFRNLAYTITRTVIAAIIEAITKAAVLRGMMNLGLISPGDANAHLNTGGYSFNATPPAAARGGMMVPSYAAGGPVRGPGTGISDSILARVSAGEFVVNKRSAQAYEPLLHAINSGRTAPPAGPPEAAAPSRVVIEDRRPAGEPPLDISAATLSARQANEVRLIVQAETARSIHQGRLDRPLRARFGARAQPIPR